MGALFLSQPESFQGPWTSLAKVNVLRHNIASVFSHNPGSSLTRKERVAPRNEENTSSVWRYIYDEVLANFRCLEDKEGEAILFFKEKFNCLEEITYGNAK